MVWSMVVVVEMVRHFVKKRRRALGPQILKKI